MSDLEQGLPARIAELREQIARQDPQSLADRAGALYQPAANSLETVDRFQGVVSLPLWGQEVQVQYPDAEMHWADSGEPLGLLDQGLLAYYLTLTDGTPPTGRWISFTELPDGRFYTQAFQSYTGDVLQRTFGSDLQTFGQAAQGCRGTKYDIGDAAYVFKALPHLPVMAVAWLGDEDFPDRYQVLFDASASQHLTTDGCAILGSSLVRRLRKFIRVS